MERIDEAIVPSEALVAAYDTPRGPFALRMFPIRPPRPGEVLVRIRMCTICRSDVHSYLGHRPNPTPGVLGHEIIGTIVALGPGVTHDLRGDPLGEGDRITWSEYFIPGESHASEVLGLPQKAPGVEKYGHLAATDDPHHHGGFGQYCYVMPRSWILRIPEALSDQEATPINCGVATVVCATEQAEIRLGDAVVVQGLGLLGLYSAALAKTRGARLVIGIDSVASRRSLGQRFGCDEVLDPSALDESGLVQRVRALCRPDGPDAVIEVCGHPEVIPSGIAMLRTGGRYVLAGVVNPDSFVTLDANRLLRKLITLRGVHNYHPRHLLEALDFVASHRTRFPFASLVDAEYRLDQVGRAMKDAEERRVLRAAIVP